MGCTPRNDRFMYRLAAINVNRLAHVAWSARNAAASADDAAARGPISSPSPAFMFLQAYEEQAAAHWQDWLRLVATLESVEELGRVAEADLPHLVALVVNARPLLDPRLLRARAFKLQLLAATAPAARDVHQDPDQVAAALRAIADIVGDAGRW